MKYIFDIRLVSAMLILATFMLLVQCSEDDGIEVEPTYTVTFTIKDKDSGEIIEGAQIQLGGFEIVQTDANGMASISGVESYRYQYAVRKEGYDELVSMLTVEGKDTDEAVLIRDENEPFHWVKFKIFEDAVPVKGAVLTINDESIISDENGEASILLQNDPYEYEVIGEIYQKQTGSIDVVGTTLTETIKLKKSPADQITGILNSIPRTLYAKGEQIDLSMLIVRAQLQNGSSHIIEFSEFDDFEITTSPVDGAELDANITSIAISGNSSFEIPIKADYDGTVTDREGNIYVTTIIGNQEWMAENLRVTTYNDGTPMKHVGDDKSVWGSLTEGAYTLPTDHPDKLASGVGEDLGALYNGYAVLSGDFCPEGWHIPSDDEWKELETYLGMPDNELHEASATRGGANEIGTKLKANSLWLEEDLGTDIYNFTGNRSGVITNTGDAWFTQGYWWGIGDNGEAWCRVLQVGDNRGALRRFSANLNLGSSIRLVKD